MKTRKGEDGVKDEEDEEKVEEEGRVRGGA